MADPKAPTTPIQIYAEYQENIGQISVVVSLQYASDRSTKAEVIDHGTTIRVHHKEETQLMTLPAIAATSAPLPLPRDPTSQLRWRIPVSPQAKSRSSFSLENQAVPWNALDLQPGSAICCRQCRKAVVEKDIVRIWKDLPSENWAEMMEFWHCHKPHDHGPTDDDHLTKRGYGASNIISAQSSVGFVDITSFMFAESDCTGLSFSTSSPGNSFDTSRAALDESVAARFLHIYCRSCSVEIGIYSALASSVTLFKWQVSCDAISQQIPPSIIQCLAATITATISRSGSAKSVLLPHAVSTADSSTEPLFALHLWVLGSNVSYASSIVDGKKHSMKVLWQEIDVESGNKLIESMTSDVQDLSLPTAVIQAARAALESSHRVLPIDERNFKEWRVGIIDRWLPPSL